MKKSIGKKETIILHVLTCVNRSYTYSYECDLQKNYILNENISHFFMYECDIYKKPMLFIKNLIKTDRIIIHGIFRKINLIIYWLIIILSKKCYWVVWGADLYNFKLYENHTFKAKLLEGLKIIFIRKINGICTLPYRDYEVAVEYTGTKAKYYQIFYKNPISLKTLDKYNIYENNNKILLGNSASITNNHFDALGKLSKIEIGTFDIICPLSYGDQIYGDEVSNFGNNLFGDRFKPIRTFLDTDEYSKLLSSVGVAIFNHDRQQGLGNILALLYLGKKVYIKKSVSSFQFLESIGVKVFDADVIDGISFEELFDFNVAFGKSNHEIIKGFYSDENFDRLWLKVFNE